MSSNARISCITSCRYIWWPPLPRESPFDYRHARLYPLANRETTYRIQRVDLLRGEPSAVPISHLPVNVTRDQRCMVGNLDSIYIRKQPKVSARQMREKIYVYY